MITCLALNILSEGITDAMAAAPSAALDPTDSSKRREADLLVSDPVRAYKEQAQSLSARLGALRDVEKRDDRHVPDESVEPILSVRDFCIQFEHHGDINVVDHVNFDVRPGQTMGLVGESGCGKSITTLAIMGLTDDDEHLSGEVLWEGRDLLKMSKKEWFGLRGTDIAMVYQDALSSLNPSMLISAQMKQLTKRGGTRSAEELWSSSASIPSARSRAIRTSLRRPASACPDRYGPYPRPQAGHLRRAHDRSGRYRPEAGHQAAQRPSGQARLCHDLRLARPGAGRRGRP